MQTATISAATRGTVSDGDYDAFLRRLNQRFTNNVGEGKPLFTTDVDTDALWASYLDAFGNAIDRQHHNCHCCRHFIQRFGGLVFIDPETGLTTPAIWNVDDADDFYKPAIKAMSKLVLRAKVNGIFLSSDKVWGTPETGVWHHLSVKPPVSMVYKDRLLTAGQKMAERREDYGTVSRALGEFTLPMVDQAMKLLATDALYRSEKVIGQARWLQQLHQARDGVSKPNRNNITWLAVALAPAGFCHPRSSMVGTLLEDIAAGMDFDDVSKRFAAKMHPLQYQRPQAAPAAGAIKAAEETFKKLGAERSLERRFVRLDEVQALWKPKATEKKSASGGLFGHLNTKGTKTGRSSVGDMKTPPVKMTWDKFQRSVMPTAELIEVYLGHSRYSMSALVTAVHDDAPPILQWDTDEQRNPVSWYVWHGGSTPSHFGLQAGEFHKVSAITLKPSMWYNSSLEHQGNGVMFVIDGARESRQAGNAIFPECLKAEFRAVRSVIEAYSKNATIEGMDEPHVCGLLQGNGGTWDVHLRVTSGGLSTEYKLDRWD